MMTPNLPILLVDDEPDALRSMRNILAINGLDHVIECSDSREVPDLVTENDFSAISLDLKMPHLSGKKLLGTITHEHPEIPVIVVTATNEIDVAVDCMKSGAYDYLLKPVDKVRLISCIRRAIEIRDMRNENTRLKSSLLASDLRNPDAFEHIITGSDSMRQLFRYVEAIAETTLPVLITGETGTGKELFAQAIHRASGRSGLLVTVNVAGLDDTMFSDTLFGHVAGAFTGASTKRDGMIRQAEAGTLFLDEIGDLSLNSQVKLLRLLQEREYLPLGSDRQMHTTARIVVATNIDIKSAVDAGTFRSDLLYRLRPHWIAIPPLRKRPEDIAVLADTFLRRACAETGKTYTEIPERLLKRLLENDFPGNVRELEGMIFDFVIRRGVPELEATRPDYRAESSLEGSDHVFGKLQTLPTADQAVALLIEEALLRAGGNQTKAAKMIDINRTTLVRRINKTR